MNLSGSNFMLAPGGFSPLTLGEGKLHAKKLVSPLPTTSLRWETGPSRLPQALTY